MYTTSAYNEQNYDMLVYIYTSDAPGNTQTSGAGSSMERCPPLIIFSIDIGTFAYGTLNKIEYNMITFKIKVINEITINPNKKCQ